LLTVTWISSGSLSTCSGGGICTLLVHALNEQAKAFYLGHGFIESPIEPMTLMISVCS
jgi:hypothetical protein